MHYRLICFTALLLAPGALHSATSRAEEELRNGIRAADVYNWTEAAVHFQAAEKLAAPPAGRTLILARIGTMRATMEQQNLARLTRDYETLSKNPVVHRDAEVRMWLYIAKGDCDNDLQYPELARRDWQLVKELARDTQNGKWIYRADGELAIPAYYLGDLATSRQLVTEALSAATAANDKASVIRLLTHIGTVYIMRDQFAPGMEHLAKAEQLARSLPEMGYPVTVKEGQVLGLIGTGKLLEAQLLAHEIIEKMQAQNRHLNEAQTRVMLATVFQLQNNAPAAVRELDIAIRMSVAGNFYHSLAEAEMRLANLYLQLGNVPQAAKCVAASLEAAQNSGIVSDLPTRMQLLAALKAKQGQFAEADALYRKAEDEVDSQLILTPMFAKQLLLKSSSEIYTEHFGLLAERRPKITGLYNTVERVRERILADLLRLGTFFNSTEDQAAEQEIGVLRLRLAAAQSTEEIARARDAVFFALHKRWLDKEVDPNGSLEHQADRILPLSTVQKTFVPPNF